MPNYRRRRSYSAAERRSFQAGKRSAYRSRAYRGRSYGGRSSYTRRPVRGRRTYYYG